MYNDFLNKIEELNADAKKQRNEIINSKEYKLGNRILMLLNFKNIPQIIRNRIMKKKLQKIHLVSQKAVYYKGELLNNTKCVVYSCITGNYDKIKEPFIKNCDYKMFTDTKIQRNSKWDICGIPKNIQYLNKKMINRYIKLHPFELFKDYDYSIYIDGNIKTISDLQTLCEIAKKSKIGIAMHKHSERTCVYDEAMACTIMGRGNKNNIIRQIEKYKKEGLPKEFGLCEAGIIVCDLHNPIAKKILDRWYEELLNSESGRDQLSLPYIIWSEKYKMTDIGILGNNIWENPMIRIIIQNKHKE